jgi:hypothetical protein
VIASTATQIAGSALALGTVTVICALAGFCTFAATKYAYGRARTRTPEWAAWLFAVVIALLTFVGGWLIVALWWTAARGTRLAHRLVA